jgi:hypothetical protein
MRGMQWDANEHVKCLGRKNSNKRNQPVFFLASVVTYGGQKQQYIYL